MNSLYCTEPVSNQENEGKALCDSMHFTFPTFLFSSLPFSSLLLFMFKVESVSVLDYCVTVSIRCWVCVMISINLRL